MLPPFTMNSSTGDWRLRDRLIPVLIGILAVILLPYFHLGFLYSFWVPERDPVDKSSCKCSCWDMIFKGSYEQGMARYKHVYFNITSNTFKIWSVTVLFAIALYESLCYLVRLYLSSKLRLSMLVLYVAVLYPHYYSWWMYFNYTNDEYYRQWNHQAFFSITELASTLVVLYLCDRSRETQPLYLLFIISIAIMHMLASGGDQFIKNVLMGSGKWYQIFRDIGFMGPDIINIVISAWLWISWTKQKEIPLRESVTKIELISAAVMILFLWAVCSIL